MGPPDTTIWEYPGADRSWSDEWEHFRGEITSGGIDCQPGVSSTRGVLSVVEQVYKQNRASWV
jgi:hypothetical protein